MFAIWLRKDKLEEFKAICRDEFGVALSDVDAHERAVVVLDLFSLLYLERWPEETSAGVDGSASNPPPTPPTTL